MTILGSTTCRDIENGAVTLKKGAVLTIEDGASIDIDEGNLVVNEGASIVVRGYKLEVKKDPTLNAGSSLDIGLKGDVGVDGDVKMNAPDAVIRNLNEFNVDGKLTINFGTFYNGTDDTSVQGPEGLDDYDATFDYLELNGGDARFINYDRWVTYIFSNLFVNSGAVTNQGKMTAVGCTINGGTVSEGICPAQ